jgi:hypothetical protein
VAPPSGGTGSRGGGVAGAGDIGRGGPRGRGRARGPAVGSQQLQGGRKHAWYLTGGEKAVDLVVQAARVLRAPRRAVLEAPNPAMYFFRTHFMIS